jgi:hypothetical protein
MRFLLAICICFFLSTAHAEFPQTTDDDVVVGNMVFHGDVPIHITGHVRELRDLWVFVRALSGIPDNGKTIHVYMVAFGEEEERYPELLALQRAWLKKAGQKEDRLPPNSTGFHYDGTTIIQVNPLLFRMHTTDAFGHSSGGVLGVGFYVIAHEMLHIAHEWKGVPGDDHHCIFLREHYEERLADFLWDRRMAPKWFLNSGVSDAEQAQWDCKKLGT